MTKGEWMIDNSAHKHNGRIGYKWEATDRDNLYHSGIEKTKEKAENKARLWASVGGKK